MSGPTYIITVRPEGSGPPPELRLKRLLKAALRCYGLRCLDVEATPQLPQDATNNRETTSVPSEIAERPAGHGSVQQTKRGNYE